MDNALKGMKNKTERPGFWRLPSPRQEKAVVVEMNRHFRIHFGDEHGKKNKEASRRASDFRDLVSCK